MGQNFWTTGKLAQGAHAHAEPPAVFNSGFSSCFSIGKNFTPWKTRVPALGNRASRAIGPRSVSRSPRTPRMGKQFPTRQFGTSHLPGTASAAAPAATPWTCGPPRRASRCTPPCSTCVSAWAVRCRGCRRGPAHEEKHRCRNREDPRRPCRGAKRLTEARQGRAQRKMLQETRRLGQRSRDASGRPRSRPRCFG